MNVGRFSGRRRKAYTSGAGRPSPVRRLDEETMWSPRLEQADGRAATERLGGLAVQHGHVAADQLIRAADEAVRRVWY
jgi:hypothetical protein